MNAEIKAAVTVIITKRDKGIELRQKQLACAISGLSGLINKEMESREKDNERLKQLMDIGRILCDVQHSESVIRRNFAIYSIKKDVKDWRAPAPAYRQQGPQWGRRPAYQPRPGPSARHIRVPRHDNSLKTSQPPQRHHQRR